MTESIKEYRREMARIATPKKINWKPFAYAYGSLIVVSLLTLIISNI